MIIMNNYYVCSVNNEILLSKLRCFFESPFSKNMDYWIILMLEKLRS
ncbi:hypothetical protein OAV88_00180 [bacterium]|nr:hypothetical protein [bacterium]